MASDPQDRWPPSGDDSVPVSSVLRTGMRCGVRVAALLWRRQLHIHREREGEIVELDDGRHFLVYRATSSSAPHDPGDAPDGELVTLAVWFRLWAVPPGAHMLAYLFERESMLNTVLFAGCPGYRTKLWSVDRDTLDYAGFYTWEGRSSAERYRRYISAVLRPLSIRGSVGGRVDAPGDPPSWRVIPTM